MNEDVKNITYEMLYKDLKFNIPFENLIPVQAVLPEKFITIIKAIYDISIAKETINMTFEEFVGTSILLSLKYSDKF